MRLATIAALSFSCSPTNCAHKHNTNNRYAGFENCKLPIIGLASRKLIVDLMAIFHSLTLSTIKLVQIRPKALSAAFVIITEEDMVIVRWGTVRWSCPGGKCVTDPRNCDIGRSVIYTISVMFLHKFALVYASYEMHSLVILYTEICFTNSFFFSIFGVFWLRLPIFPISQLQAQCLMMSRFRSRIWYFNTSFTVMS